MNDWVNNRDAGDLRRHRAHYDVIVNYVSHISGGGDLWALVTVDFHMLISPKANWVSAEFLEYALHWEIRMC